MLELIFQGFMEWAYWLTLECWEYFSSSLLSIMSMDYAYMKSHVPVMVSITQVLLAVGWALLIGNLVFQALKSMAVGLGFEGEDPKLLFTRTFVFAFLLMASPQICEVGLSLTARIIELLEIPDAIDVTLVDEGAFGSLNAAWLLVIIFGLIIMFKVFRLLLEIAERYVILAVLTMTAPLAFAMGGSKSTSEIFGGWCRMFGSMCTLMVTNVIFFKMLLSVLSNVPSGLDIIPWIVLALTIVKVARKADAIITRIGLNPAITGDSLGRGFPGTLTYMVMRSATSHITKTIGKSTGKGNRGAASGSTTGGPRIGGGHPERTMLPVILQVIRLIKPRSNRILRRGRRDKALFLSVKAFNQAEHSQPRRNIFRVLRCTTLLQSGRQHLEGRKHERALCHLGCGERLLM